MLSLILLAVSATLLLTILVMRLILPGGDPALRREVARFVEAREIISRYFIGEVDESALTDAALSAVVAALDDSWSNFMTAEQYAAHLRAVGNRRQGIGLVFSRDEETNEIVVVETTPESPAEEAGLVTGDVLVAFITTERQYTPALETEDIRDIIDAHFGGTLTLEVRDESGVTRTVLVEVREFFVNPVSFEMLERAVGYIRIANFDSASGAETIAAIETLRKEGAVGLLFDVRSNPGGRVGELLQILDYLLPEGEIFVFEDYAGNESIRYAGPDYLDMPMVVLVNENSFSGAEFFAAILQEEERATVVGMPTTGKGRSQLIIPLEGGGAIRLSTSRYLTPGRVDLYEAGGIRPDVQVENVDETDRQLERARQILLGS